MVPKKDVLLRVTDLRIEGYSDEKWVEIVHGVNLTLHKGEVLGLIGESGAGKSTIGLASMGFARDGCRISGGSIEFDGMELTTTPESDLRALRGSRIAYVAQSAAASFNPAHRIIDQHTEAPIQYRIQKRVEAQEDAMELYERLRLPNPNEIGFRYPHQVSGGQLQRAMTAMAMACRPDLIIFDEPTTALDVTTQIEVLAAIRDIVDQFNTAAIYITHDLAVVAQMADTIKVLLKGEEVEEAPTEQMLGSPKEDYTKSLWAVRSFQRPQKQRPTEAGAIPIVSVQGIDAAYGKTKALKQPGVLEGHELNALDIAATSALIRKTGAQIVINVGTAFLNMSVLSACLETGAAYIDTAIHEEPGKICETPPWYGNYEWKRAEECAAKGVTAILGAGFDPGVVNAYARLAKDDYLDKVTEVDIVDINAGSHQRYFATNFDPEINFREFTGTVYSWQQGKWQENKMFEIGKEYDLPVVGKRMAYLCGHDEVHSLAKNMDGADVRFWMGFGEHYINVFTVLKNIGLLSEQPVKTAEGLEVVPLKVVKACLPDPSSLAPEYTGKTCIGDFVKGTKDGKEHEVFIYNVADHKEAYEEVGSQGISYTAGVPPVAAAMLIATGEWDVKKMANVEELPPHPFLGILNRIGLPTRIKDAQGDRALEF
eukprot:g20775.t1